MHVVAEYYCRQAGLTVYKTPDQWKAENPGVAETLTWDDVWPRPKILEGQWKGCERLNERFVSCYHKRDFWPLPVRAPENEIVDTLSGEVLVHSRSVYAGYSGRYSDAMSLLRFYVGERNCPRYGTGFPTAEKAFRQIEKGLDPPNGCYRDAGCREIFDQLGWRFDQ
jgi:hypothetical protein